MHDIYYYVEPWEIVVVLRKQHKVHQGGIVQEGTPYTGNGKMSGVGYKPADKKERESLSLSFSGTKFLGVWDF